MSRKSKAMLHFVLTDSSFKISFNPHYLNNLPLSIIYHLLSHLVLSPLKTRIIAVANHKGGVGKTTTVATLGSIFAKVGMRVLMVDLDAQCNLTDTFLSEVEGPTVYEVFKDRRDYLPTRIKDGLDILPASLDMSALDIIIGGQFEKERILSDVLEKMDISERYDLVLLDCPPSLGLVTVNALVAADEVYVPIAPEVYPLKGLVKLEEICSMVSARLNPGIGITGVIVTMFNPTKNLFVTVDEKLRGIYGDKVFRTRIRENVKLAECPMHRTEITSYAPESNGATDYVNLAKEILARLDEQQ